MDDEFDIVLYGDNPTVCVSVTCAFALSVLAKNPQDRYPSVGALYDVDDVGNVTVDTGTGIADGYLQPLIVLLAVSISATSKSPRVLAELH